MRRWGKNGEQILREIIRDAAFEKQASALEPDISRMDDRLAAVEWALARDAESHLAFRNVGVIKLRPFGTAPELRAFFTIDSDNQATLRYIEALDDDA